MTERVIANVRGYHVRAKVPVAFRYAALGLLGLSVLAVAIAFYRARTTSPFRLKSEHTQLSTDVTAEINGYERLETDDAGIPKYLVKADYAKTFADNHQELANAYFEVYQPGGAAPDKMKADQVLYVPEENKNFTAYMKGNVDIETRDALRIKTNNIVYTKATEIADADELVEFGRGGIRGKSLGALVRMAEKKIDLLRDVEIETFESAELARSNVRYAKVNAGSATYDHAAAKIELNGNVAVSIDSRSSRGSAVRTDTTAGRATLDLEPFEQGGDETSARLKTLQLFDSVHITSTEAGSGPTVIDAGYALYDKGADRYELKNAVHIVTTTNDKSTDIRSGEALYDQRALKMSLKGDAEVTQGGDYAKGSSITADLFADKQVRYIMALGDALVKQTAAERIGSIAAPKLEAWFSDARQMRDAASTGASTAQIVPVGKADYSLVTISAPNAIRATFKGEGRMEKVTTDGRTTIQLDVPNTDADAANKRVTADRVSTFFNSNGTDISGAEAVGNAELYIEPLRAAEANYRTTVNAPRFDCEFFPTGNNAKQCTGAKGTRTARVPTVQKPGRGVQTFSADRLTANFNATTKAVDSFVADGRVKFTELARTATASQMTFTAADERVSLRGAEPTVWDDRGRATAREIDWDTKNQRSYLRGGVSTTYYTREKVANAAPFASSEKPVFMTGETAEFDHASRVGVYTGNARGWQESNFVKADRITIDERAGRFLAEGNVQSAVYNAKQKMKGKEATVPVFATARSMNYLRDSRVLQYRDNVDIRQGTDRMTSASADIYLSDANELSRTVAENNVVITQPGRRATGNWVQYSAGDEVAILRGSPAHVSDSVNGSSQAAELTFMMRDNRVVSESKAKPGSTGGRIRSTYKISPKP